MALYEFTLPTEETTKFFEDGCWYRGINGDKGLVVKSTGVVERNFGWWCGAEFIARLVSPCNWDKIEDKNEIYRLESKLKTHELKELWKRKNK